MNRSFRLSLLACLLTLAASSHCLAARYVLITILHTNDMHGRVMPDGESGGLARAATIARGVRTDMPNVLLLDSGDTIHGTAEEYYSGGKAIIAAMNAVGYQASVTGNHEYDFGLDTLQRVIQSASFPFLAANVRARGGGQWDGVASHVILTVDGVRIGMIGLTTLDTITLHWPGMIRELQIEDPIETARSLVPEIRRQVDVLVILSHLGDVLDERLAKEVAGIDFIIGGHSHTIIDNWRWVGDTLITQTGAYAKAVGRIDFIVRVDEQGGRVESVNGKRGTWNELARPPLGKKYPSQPLIPVDNSLPPDAAVLEAYLPFRAATETWLSQVVAEAPDGVPGGKAVEGETAVGDFMADAAAFISKSDVALIDAGSVSTNGIPAGPVTVGTLFNMVGGFTRQHIVVARMDGAQLEAALEKRLIGRKGIGLQVSGISFDYALQDDKAEVMNLEVRGQPVDPGAYYTVAAQAYVMMDMMQAMPDIQTIAELRESTREALVEYARALKIIRPPELGRMRRADDLR